MEKLHIVETDETPMVLLDAANLQFEFSGKSLPEDVTSFYGPILDWIDDYADEMDGEEAVFKFNLIYFNTASSKMILDIFMAIEGMVEDGKNVSVEWIYDEDDEDMEEAGEEYADIVEVPFKMISN
jgi:hypothetical protein